MKKLFLKLFVVIIFVFIFIPSLIVNAEECETVVAKIGDTNYCTIDNAIDYANSGDKIVLSTNVGIISIASDKDVSIDLNGNSADAIYNRGKAKISNGTVTGNGNSSISIELSPAIINYNDAIIVLNDVKFNVLHSTATAFVNKGVATLDNSQFVYRNDENDKFAVVFSNSGTITVNGGTYKSYQLIKNSGLFTINGGSFSSSSNNSSINNEGEMIINDGIFNSPDYYNVWNDSKDSKLTVNGGIFNAKDNFWIHGILDVYNGTFNSEEEFIATSPSSKAGEININIYDCKVKSNGSKKVIGLNGLSGDIPSILHIYGGNFEAPDSYGISRSSGNWKIIIGDNTDEVTSDSSYIDIKNGIIENFNGIVEFYDGKILLKNKIDEVTFKPSEILVPEGYHIQYDLDEGETYYTAYLVKDVIENGNTNTDIGIDNNTSEHNPETGDNNNLYVNIILISTLLMTIAVAVIKMYSHKINFAKR